MDKNAIRELVILYGEFLEAEDWSHAETEKVFSDTASVEFAVGGVGTGTADISAKHKNMMALFKGAHHNITNIMVQPVDDTHAKVCFHMEVIHEFKPEIAKEKPGNLLIVNDRIHAEAVCKAAAWKFEALKMEPVYKRFTSSL